MYFQLIEAVPDSTMGSPSGPEYSANHVTFGKVAVLVSSSLFRKKMFEINFFVRRNASKFAIFIEKENPRSFFRFSFRAFLSFPL